MPGFVDDAARRAHGAAADLGRDLADVERELRGAGERVAALVHRRRAGVRRLAAPGERASARRRTCPSTTPSGQVHRLEHRPLLDVQLEVRRGVRELRARAERAVEVDAVLAQRVRQRDPVAVVQRAQLVLVAHRAGRGRRAEERAAEARALLVGPVDEPHGHRRLALRGDAPQHLDAREHVQAAVEPAAVRHRVHVPADQQRPLRGAAEREPLVARPRRSPRRAPVPASFSRSQLARLLPGLRPGDPLGAVVVAGQLAELLELGDGARRIERHESDPKP